MRTDLPRAVGGADYAPAADPRWATVAVAVAAALTQHGPCTAAAAVATIQRALCCSPTGARQALAASEDAGAVFYHPARKLWHVTSCPKT